MKQSTLCFCRRRDEVLLAMKRRGFGAGLWNGLGGKVEARETPIVAAVREVFGESKMIVEAGDLRKVAVVNFSFDGNLVFECHSFLTERWQGEPVDTEEMIRPTWFPLTALPYAEMWPADHLWLPLIFSGQMIQAAVNFNAAGTIVKNFSYLPAEFI